MSITAVNLSHLVIASRNVTRSTEFFCEVFGVQPHYSNQDFSDFVLPSGSRVAFFRPVGKSTRFFDAELQRGAVSFGITVADVQSFYAHCVQLQEKYALSFSGPPKEHPWGEASFLLIDPEGNRWEITQSPSENGMLVDKPLDNA